MQQFIALHLFRGISNWREVEKKTPAICSFP